MNNYIYPVNPNPTSTVQVNGATPVYNFAGDVNHQSIPMAQPVPSSRTTRNQAQPLNVDGEVHIPVVQGPQVVQQPVPQNQPSFYPMSYSQRLTYYPNGMNGSMNGNNGINIMPMMYMNPNIDRYVTLYSKPTYVYCSNCDAVVLTKIPTPKSIIVALIIFFSSFVLFPILAQISFALIDLVVPLIFIVYFGTIVFLICASRKTKHFCPVCNTVIGRTGETVRIPA